MAVRDEPEETKWVTAESRPYRIVRPAYQIPPTSMLTTV